MLCIDSNVWIYYVDATAVEHGRVRAPVSEAIGKRVLFANAVIPLEVTHYLQNRLEDGREHARWLLELDEFEVEPVDRELVGRANDLLASHPEVGIGGRDAALVAAMERRGVSELWTHDEGLKRLDDGLDWLDVTDPAA